MELLYLLLYIVLAVLVLYVAWYAIGLLGLPPVIGNLAVILIGIVILVIVLRKNRINPI